MCTKTRKFWRKSEVFVREFSSSCVLFPLQGAGKVVCACLLGLSPRGPDAFWSSSPFVHAFFFLFLFPSLFGNRCISDFLFLFLKNKTDRVHQTFGGRWRTSRCLGFFIASKNGVPICDSFLLFMFSFLRTDFRKKNLAFFKFRKFRSSDFLFALVCATFFQFFFLIIADFDFIWLHHNLSILLMFFLNLFLSFSSNWISGRKFVRVDEKRRDKYVWRLNWNSIRIGTLRWGLCGVIKVMVDKRKSHQRAVPLSLFLSFLGQIRSRTLSGRLIWIRESAKDRRRFRALDRVFSFSLILPQYSMLSTRQLRRV